MPRSRRSRPRRHNCLPYTTFVEIEGGNHAGFDGYGEQDGDGQASITREAQQEQVVAATLDLIEAVAAR